MVGQLKKENHLVHFLKTGNLLEVTQRPRDSRDMSKKNQYIMYCHR